jgi:hypothetical protein
MCGHVSEAKVDLRNVHRKTLEAIFTDPVSGSIKWREIEALLVALGAEATEGSGSRVRFALNGSNLFIHRPHPAPEATKYVGRTVREFLTNLGIEP